MKSIIISVILALTCLMTNAQSPMAFNYQAVIRNSSGNVLADQEIQIRFTLLKASDESTLYSETHQCISSALGLIHAFVGEGTVVSGDFGLISWAEPVLLVSECDDNGTWVSLDTTRLLSVPYAMYASEAGNGFSGDYNDLSNQPDFTGWDNNSADDFDGQYSSLSGTPANVSHFVNDAGYLTAEADGSASNELQILSIRHDTIFLTSGGFVKLPAGFDGQYTSLSGAPQNLSDFNNDMGFMTADEDSTNELQTLSISNDSLRISEGNVIKLPGVKITSAYVNTIYVSSYTTSAGNNFFKLGNVTTFVKESSKSVIEVLLNTHSYVSSIPSSTHVMFQIRIDDQPAGSYDTDWTIFAGNTSYTNTSVTRILSNLSAGTHTVSIWAGNYNVGETANDVYVNPGGYCSSRIIIKEYFAH